MSKQLVAIIGGGPYGLSLASHLAARNVPEARAGLQRSDDDCEDLRRREDPVPRALGRLSLRAAPNGAGSVDG
jgi:glycerol-3-phosphate dehydrogenase